MKSVIRVSMYIRELMTLIQYTADAEKDAGMKNMKLEEAIKTLQDMKVDIPVPKAAVMQTKRNVALDMAIDALKCSEIPNSLDTISRQAAIDALQKCRKHCIDPFDSYHIDINDAECQLSEVPSAQPKSCEDAVSRSLMREIGATCMARRGEDGELYALGSLDMLPSVTPEQKKREWIFVHPLQDNDIGAYMCSVCKHGDFDIKPSSYNFCPYCGAKMLESEGE